MTPTIYRIEFPDGQVYVGATTNYTARRQAHLRHGAKGKGVNTRLARAMSEFFPVLAICPIASPLRGVPLHELEAQVITTQQPSLNVNLKPSALCKGHAGGRAFGGYPTVAEYARANGLDYSTLKKQTRGLSFEQWQSKRNRPALSKASAKIGPPDPRKDVSLIHIDGWVRKRDVCVVAWGTYEHRTERGWDQARALTTPVSKAPSASAVALRYGVDPNTYYQRRHSGWTLHEALGLTARPKPQQKGHKMKPRLITVNGVTRTLQHWAALANLKPNVVYARLFAGWTEAQAVGREPSDKAKQVAQKKAEKEARRVAREAKARAPKPPEPHPFDEYVRQLERSHSPEEALRIATHVLGHAYPDRGTVS